jgi:hypothetical protein
MYTEGHMEFDKPFRPNKHAVTEEKVLFACQALSDVLAKGEWFSSPEARKVVIERSFTQIFGIDLKSSITAGEKIKESAITTRVSFIGEKDATHLDDGIDFEETYIVSARVTEVLGYEELPEHIKQKLLDMIDSDSHLRARIQRMGDIDETFDLMREQKVVYCINESGDISDYSVTFRYLGDDEVLGEAEYGMDDAGAKLVATTYIDNKALEWQSTEGETINQEDVGKFMESFDSIIDLIETKEKFDHISDEAYYDESEHNRRVLAMIAMSSSGLSIPTRFATNAKLLFRRVFRKM